MDPKDRNIDDREVVSMRVIDAPRELVFKAWTEPEHLKNWWGPKGYTNTILSYHLEPGGMWEFVMRSPNGTDYDNKYIFSEIVKPERLCFEHISIPNFYVTTDFVEHLGKTKITLRVLFGSVLEYDQMKEETLKSNEQNFDRLEVELLTMRGETLAII